MFAGLFRPTLAEIDLLQSFVVAPTKHSFHKGSPMPRRYHVFPLVAVFLAACSADVVAPLKVPTGPKLAINVEGGSSSYIVATNGKGFPADFADKVASLGGNLTYANDKAGFALVSGLSAASASELGTM